MSKLQVDKIETYTGSGTLEIESNTAVSAGKNLVANGPFTSNNATTINGAGNSLTIAQGNVLANGSIYSGPSSSSPGCTLNADGSAVVGTLSTGAATINGTLDLNQNSIVDVNAITCASMTIGGTAYAGVKAFCNVASGAIAGGTGFSSVSRANGAGTTSIYTLTLATSLASISNTIVQSDRSEAASYGHYATIVDVNTITVTTEGQANTEKFNVVVIA